MARLNIFPRLSLIIVTLGLVFVYFVGAKIDKNDTFHLKHLSKRPLETYEAAFDLVTRRQMKEPNKTTNYDPKKKKVFTDGVATVLQSSKKDFKNAFSEGRKIRVLNNKTNQKEWMRVGNAPIKSTTIRWNGRNFQVWKNPEMYPVARFKGGKAIHLAGFVSSKNATELDKNKSYRKNQIRLMPNKGKPHQLVRVWRTRIVQSGYKKPSPSPSPVSRGIGKRQSNKSMDLRSSGGTGGSSKHHQQKKSRWDQKPSRSPSPDSRGNENRHSPKG